MQQRCICVERGNLDNNKFHSIFCYFFLDCRVGTSSLLAMTISVSTQAIQRHSESLIQANFSTFACAHVL
ncbi:hypothetical protein [Rickettsia endosymbiont of Orchestes rusci]|uniref:hypothetical protein n=1 Tax=Rickettsia endosymbiont of Orchestes rusci TaxID=3066250 RepID=UPI00397A9F81